MKIEMGESLIYSWLRHVKSCQVVQMNWKASPLWPLRDRPRLEGMMALVAQHYDQTHGYTIFKKNTSLQQLLRQGECDVLGIATQPESSVYYAAEVAFHESGLCYGSRQETVMKVLEKFARTAFCLHGYLAAQQAEILFASPKITPAVLAELAPCVEELNLLFAESGFAFTFRVIANGDFNQQILQPILGISGDVADTSELFLRSYQMYRLFPQNSKE